MITEKITLARALETLKDFDWSKIDVLTDADIDAQIAADPDVAPDMSDLRDDVDMAGIRNRLKMTQAEFAQAFGFTKASVRSIEQGRRNPSGTAVTVLKLIARDPDYVRQTLGK